MNDLISRQAAIDAIDVLCQEHRYRIPGKGETYSQYNEAWQDALDRAEGAIFNLPSAQPEQRWIPVTERLPENGRQQVLVYARSVHYALAKYDEMREADGSYKKQWVTFDAWKPFYTIKEVIAWMPLPEPYQGKRKGADS